MKKKSNQEILYFDKKTNTPNSCATASTHDAADEIIYFSFRFNVFSADFFKDISGFNGIRKMKSALPELENYINILNKKIDVLKNHTKKRRNHAIRRTRCRTAKGI